MPHPIIEKPYPTTRFVLPFPRLRRGNGTYEEMDPLQCLKTWGRTALDGFYPLGLSGQWHGGIHFDNSTGRQLYQEDGVRCITDGEVIAYRYDDELLQSQYSSDRLGEYSTSFVLVRHRLMMPQAVISEVDPMPTASNSGPADTHPSRKFPPSVVFYSLYMNLRHRKAYELDQTLPRPHFWPNDGRRRKLGKMCTVPFPTDFGVTNPTGVSVGHPLRKVVPSTNPIEYTIEAWLPQGATLTLGTATHGASTGKMYALASIDGAAQLVRKAGDTTAVTDLWIYDGVLDRMPALPNHGSVQVLSTPIPIAAGDLIGHLGVYERYEQEISTHADREQVHIETFFAKNDLKTFIESTCQNSLNPTTPVNAAASIKKILGRILKIESGALLCRVAIPDSNLPSGVALRPAANSPKNGLWIKLERGTSTGAGNFNPSGGTVWIARNWYQTWHSGSGSSNSGIVVVPHAHSEVWTSFPLAQGQSEEEDRVPLDRIIDISSQGSWGNVLDIAVDDSGKRWWQVSTGYSVSTLQEGETRTQIGWVCEEGHDKVSLYTSWDWPKFQVLRDTTEPGDFQLMRLENNYAQNVPLGLKPYFDLIDMDKSGSLDLTEIHAAWQDFNQVQTLSRLILQHWSEWGLGMDKWNTLDTYFNKEVIDSNGNKHNFKDIWEKEKKRIEKMRFWESVQGQNGFPTNIELDHVHPLALIENFGSFKHLDIRWPLASNRIRRGEQGFLVALKNTFGWVRNTSQMYRKAHQGWDIYAEPGTECYAIADGVVVEIRSPTGYGLSITIL